MFLLFKGHTVKSVRFHRKISCSKIKQFIVKIPSWSITYLVNLNLFKSLLNVNDAISIRKFILQYFYRNFILHSKVSSKFHEALWMYNTFFFSKYLLKILVISNMEGYATYTVLPEQLKNTNQKHILLTGNYDSISKLSKNIQFEKCIFNISENLRENCILQGLCVPLKYL